MAVDVDDDFAGSVGEGWNFREKEGRSGEFDAEGGIQGAESMVVEEKIGFGTRDGLALSVARINQDRAGVDGHGSLFSLAEVERSSSL